MNDDQHSDLSILILAACTLAGCWVALVFLFTL
jgi:hypothetical protein